MPKRSNVDITNTRSLRAQKLRPKKPEKKKRKNMRKVIVRPMEESKIKQRRMKKRPGKPIKQPVWQRQTKRKNREAGCTN